LLGTWWHPLGHRRPGPLHRAVHRRGRGVEDPGDLGGGEPEHFPEEQHRALGARQVLQRRNECQLDALPAQVRRLRLGLVVCGQIVGPRLEPDRTGHRLPQIAGV
jgi:hypothetical protein